MRELPERDFPPAPGKVVPDVIPADIICQNCGWRNEPTARMCGGCGQPLRPSDPGATVYAGASTTPAAPAAAASVAPSVISPDAPTLAGHATGMVGQPLQGPGQVVTPLPPEKVPWPGVNAGRKAKAPGGTAPWWRLPAIVGMVLVVIIGSTLGVWTLGVQPSMHADFDAQIRSVLDSGIYEVFQGKTPSGKQIITIQAAAFNNVIKTLGKFPKDGAVSQVSIAFANGHEIVTYSFWGSSGTATTSLGAENGRAVARGTVVDCPLCLIESGDQMEQAFNEPFLKFIPSAFHVTSVQTDNNALKITLG